MSEHKGILGLLEKSHEQMLDNLVEEKEGFTDPVLRCDSCNKIVTKNVITKLGLCNHCGNKRFRAVDVISELELIQIKKLDGADDFLELFEEVNDEGFVDNLFMSAPLFNKPLKGVEDEK